MIGAFVLRLWQIRAVLVGLIGLAATVGVSLGQPAGDVLTFEEFRGRTGTLVDAQFDARGAVFRNAGVIDLNQLSADMRGVVLAPHCPNTNVCNLTIEVKFQPAVSGITFMVSAWTKAATDGGLVITATYADGSAGAPVLHRITYPGRPTFATPVATPATVERPIVSLRIQAAPDTTGFMIDDVRFVQVPPVAEPPVAEPPVADPPVTDPPVTDPPVTDPPVADPAVADPPVADPPVVKPPIVQPNDGTNDWIPFAIAVALAAALALAARFMRKPNAPPQSSQTPTARVIDSGEKSQIVSVRGDDGQGASIRYQAVSNQADDFVTVRILDPAGDGQ